MCRNEKVHARLVKTNRDLMGDLESVIIEDEDKKRIQVSIDQVEQALRSGRIEIDGLKIAKKSVKETRRPKNKRPPNIYKETLKRIRKDMEKCRYSDPEKYYKLTAKYEELLRDERYRAEDEKIMRDLDRNKKF